MVCNADCDVGRRTAYKFFKIVNLFQRLEILFHIIAVSRVKVDADSAKQDQIKFSGLVKINIVHFSLHRTLAHLACFLRALFVCSLCFNVSTRTICVQHLFRVKHEFYVLHNCPIVFLSIMDIPSDMAVGNMCLRTAG